MDSNAIALAMFLLDEHDAAVRDVERTKVMPTMNANARGRLAGTDMALAYMAGQNGYHDVDPFIVYLRGISPRPYSIPEGEARALDGNR